MSIMVDLPPQMVEDVRTYVAADNEALAQMFVDYLRLELNRRLKARKNPLSRYVGCIADGRRSDEIVSDLRGYGQW